MKNKIILTSFALALPALAHAQDSPRPNVVLIMCDDMGFSDLGCYGSEIKTPNIDRLAKQGLRFSKFKNTGRSCPSRACLITGQYQHDAGMGWMTAVDEHRPGYRGQISFDIPTIAESFREGGYSTYMVGKWHLTVDGAFGAPNGSYPTQRGFDRYYGCLSGGGSYYKPKPVYNDLEPVTDFPDDYYYTKAISDSASAFISRHSKDNPFFMYVAYYAPHQPLQAPEDRVERCRERYRAGFDRLREQRFRRQKEMGLVPQDMELPVFEKEFNGGKPKWEDFSDAQKEQWVNNMATYAAMIEIMDDGVGEIVETLKNEGRLDNTVFIFLSDNGGTSESGLMYQLIADLSNTPYRSYKRWVFQGGTSTPLIISFGKESLNARKGEIDNNIGHIIDIFPTCLDLCGLSNTSNKLAGISLVPALSGKRLPSRDLYFEHQSSSAIISGKWKLVRYDMKTPWELINIAEDPFETTDLAEKYPEKVRDLENKWNKWAENHKVLPMVDLGWGEHIRYFKERYPDQDGID